MHRARSSVPRCWRGPRSPARSWSPGSSRGWWTELADQRGKSELLVAIDEVGEKARVLVQEEIALAKAELTVKLTGLARGADIGAAAGVFVLAGLIYCLHFLALLIADVLGVNPWVGYLIVAGLLFIAGGVAGFMAMRFFKKGSPPTPQMAIEEAQLIKSTLTDPHPATPSGSVAARAASDVEA